VFVITVLDEVPPYAFTCAPATRCCDVRLEFWRLKNANVAALDLLIECAALILFVRRNPRATEDDDRLIYSLAHAVLKLTKSEQRWIAKSEKRHRPPGSRVLRAIGQELRRELVGIFLNVATGIEKAEEAARRRQHALKIPFDVEPLEAKRLLDELTGTNLGVRECGQDIRSRRAGNAPRVSVPWSRR
jgi:hypothetical protein